MGEIDSTSDRDSSLSVSLFIVSAAACTSGEGREEREEERDDSGER